MTIQISVLIWTVISFVLLMVILRNLLFKPVLELIDSRREKIKKAGEKKLYLEKLAQDREKLYIEKKEIALNAHQQQVKNKVEEIRLQSKKDIDEARNLRLQKTESYHEAVEAQQKALLSDFAARADEIAVRFAESLIKQ